MLLYVTLELKLNHKSAAAPSWQYSEGQEILKCLYKWKEISCGFGVHVVIIHLVIILRNSRCSTLDKHPFKAEFSMVVNYLCGFHYHPD